METSDTTLERVNDDLPLTTVNTIYHYKGYGDCDCHCQLRIWKRDGFPVVAMVSELASNQGTSVTNMCEYLWYNILLENGLCTAGTIFLEHYPAQRHVRREDQYSLITFQPITRSGYGLPGKKALGKPDWKHISIQAVLSLIDGERDH